MGGPNLLVITIVCFIAITAFSQSQAVYQYPPIEKENVIDTLFQKVIPDPYRFLEHTEDERTLNFIQAQYNFLKEQLNEVGNVSLLGQQLLRYNYADFKPLIKQGKYFFQYGRTDSKSAPSLFYQSRMEENWTDLAVSSKQFNLSKDDVASIKGFKLSKDSRYVAVSLSHSGSDWREIRVVDIKKQKTLPDQIQWVRFSDIYWKNNGFFYCRYDEPEPGQSLSPIKHQKLYYHTMGTGQTEDKVIYEIPNSSYSSFSYEVSADQSTLFLYSVITSNGKKYYSILSKNLNVPEADYFNPLITWPYLSETSYSVIHKEGNKVFVLSNKEGFNRSILEFDLDKRNKGVSLIPPAKGRLQTAKVIGKKMVCVYVQDYQTFFSVYDLKGNLLKTWGIPPTAAVRALYGDAEDTQMIYCFESFFYPPSFYTADLQTFERKPVSWTGIRFSTDDLMTDYVTYPSKDGTMIPMYITHKSGIKRTGNNPCLVTGYGGFGISATPHFDPAFQVIYENGGIVAVPCIRGGGEKEGWHEAGKNLNKMNSIDDFIYAAEYLIKEKYTSAGKLASYGASNGGMLVAAAMLKRPDLFSSIVSEVGVHDMLRYQHFTGGHIWRDEYGLSTDSAEFKNLLSYSPIHNIKDGINYPPTLAITAVNDDRVPPLHSYKFIATLQNSGAKENPYLLFLQKRAGHSGSEVEVDAMIMEAFKLAFIFRHWGMKDSLSQRKDWK